MLASSVGAMGPEDQLQLVSLRYTGNWNSRPYATHVWSQEVRFRTSIDVRLDGTLRSGIALTDRRLFELPIAVLSGDMRFRLSQVERMNLKKWVESGGFLIVDNTGLTRPSESCDQTHRAQFKTKFPGRPRIKIPPSNVLFSTQKKL
ncbi:MAG: DUF4159 domain-containing protein [Myxococcota bacterium]|nr:DUF4159 domain-containing protein [Myxococcota bacterium]